MRPKPVRQLLVLSLLISASLATVVSPRAFAGHRVESYILDATFFPAEHRIEARAQMGLQPVADEGCGGVFYLHGELTVDSVYIDGAQVPFVRELVFYYYNYSAVASKITVDLGGLGPIGSMTIAYSGYFHPCKARTPSDYMRIDREGVFLRAYGYSLWFPVFLEPGEDSYSVSFPDVTIRTPRDYTAVFVGSRVGESEEAAMRVSKWRAEGIDLFDVQCTAREYDVLEEGGYSIYSYPDRQSGRTAERIVDFARSIDRFCRNHYRRDGVAGEVHIIQMPRYGDISSANVVGISEGEWEAFGEDRYGTLTLAHEYVHPFVAVPVNTSNALYALVVEGMPSYFHLPALAEIHGEEFYAEFMTEDVERGYLAKRETGKDLRGQAVPVEKPILEIAPEEIGVYKDAFVLSDRALLFFNYLRVNMGETRFLDFSSELLNLSSIDYGTLEAVILKYLPGAGADIRVWLATTSYPDAFRLRNL